MKSVFYKTSEKISISFLFALFLFSPPVTHSKKQFATLEQTFEKTNLSTKILNSERIELKYGNYGIDVLQSDKKLRVSNLYSKHKGKKITRTFALVLYPRVIEKAFINEHTQIVQGASMGATFKKNGWKISKESIYRNSLQASPKYKKIYQLMGNIEPSSLAIYIYNFYIQKDEKKFAYASIAEIYHPDYLTEENLQQMYRGNLKRNKITKQMVEALQSYLKP